MFIRVEERDSGWNIVSILKQQDEGYEKQVLKRLVKTPIESSGEFEIGLPIEIFDKILYYVLFEHLLGRDFCKVWEIVKLSRRLVFLLYRDMYGESRVLLPMVTKLERVGGTLRFLDSIEEYFDAPHGEMYPNTIVEFTCDSVVHPWTCRFERILEIADEYEQGIYYSTIGNKRIDVCTMVNFESKVFRVYYNEYERVDIECKELYFPIVHFRIFKRWHTISLDDYISFRILEKFFKKIYGPYATFIENIY